ncbi:MAG: carboxymuconolactone decarboxylase family protein [Chloroflexi bacterium]|nr:carboxymuconolactone decarboxylase family protein [Chloroflexota bacterium]
MPKEQQEFIDSLYQDRGYVMDFHKVMAAEDFPWLKAYDAWSRATYTAPRLLDRKTKELVQTAVETALRANPGQIREHIRLAMQHGASKQEVLEAIECVAAPMGMLSFLVGVQAWAEEVGARRVEPSRRTK